MATKHAVIIRDLDELGQSPFLREQAGDPGYSYLPCVTYWDEDIDGSETEYVLYYHWSDPIPGVYAGPIELCHPPEGGADPDTVTKDGVPVQLNTVPDDIYDVLMQRANEQGDKP